MSNKLFFCVDVQNDFVTPNGALYIKDSERIVPVINDLLSSESDYEIIFTRDWHRPDSVEFSKYPDFKKTYPPHCIAYTHGADFAIDVNSASKKFKMAYSFLKDEFDVFGWRGSEGIKSTLDSLSKRYNEIFVFGCVYEVCVNYAVLGLQTRFNKVSIYRPGTAGFSPVNDLLPKFNPKIVRIIDYIYEP
jgi:nicotinamidase/pyrazinamidase